MKFIADSNCNAERMKLALCEIVDKAAAGKTKPQVIKVSPEENEYTDLQRSALWGLAYKILSEETGNDSEDLHTFFCMKYFGEKEIMVMGKRKLKPVRTTTRDEAGKRDVISTKDLAQMFELIQRMASTELGIYIPDPDPDFRRRCRSAA